MQKCFLNFPETFQKAIMSVDLSLICLSFFLHIFVLPEQCLPHPNNCVLGDLNLIDFPNNSRCLPYCYFFRGCLWRQNAAKWLNEWYFKRKMLLILIIFQSFTKYHRGIKDIESCMTFAGKFLTWFFYFLMQLPKLL